MPLDLREFEQVDALGPSIGVRFRRLDILVHCAGALGRLAPIAHLLPAEWDEAIGVNATAALRLIRTTEGLLRQAPAGRAVFVTTARARAPKAYWGCYGAAKAALEHLALSWADEVGTTTPIRVNLFDPGAVATRLRRAAYPGEVASALPPPEAVAPALASLCLPAEARNGEIVRIALTRVRGDPRVARLMLLFAIVYVVEGIGQARVGIIAQPLTWFLKTSGWTPVQVTAYLAIFNLPWVIKPVYGIFSDFVPLFGYRRKSYLLIAAGLATASFAYVAALTDPGPMAPFLILTAYAMAIGSTMCGALLVEDGQRFGASGAFVNQQWLWFSVATLASAVAGGELVQRLSPLGAVHTAAIISALAPLAVIAAALWLIDEERHRVNLPELRRTLGSLLSVFRSRTLYLLGGFLFLYSFSPGFGTPLYFYMTDRLRFSQSYIGELSAIASAGWIVGALAYRRLVQEMRLRVLLNLSIALGTLSTLSFLLLSGEVSAALVNFGSGIAAMVANVATLTLAAVVCPKRSEGFVFAAMMSIINLAAPASDTAGAFLYEHIFHARLAPLVVVSAACTAFAFVLVPLMRIGSIGGGCLTGRRHMHRRDRAEPRGMRPLHLRRES